jgi:hypothetical protein
LDPSLRGDPLLSNESEEKDGDDKNDGRGGKA